MNKFEAKFQIGKLGITSGIIQSFESALKTHKQIRISVLKSAGRDREKVKKIASEISEKLEKFEVKSKYKIIGFTIILKKLKK